LLVPTSIARRNIKNIALFLHVPFPSSDLFRSLSVRDELLTGMLMCDHVAFHLFEYARHFLTCCRRILGLTHSQRPKGRMVVEFQGREVGVSASHVGVEPEFLVRRVRERPEIMARAARWRAAFPGRRLVGSIDTVERLKGVPLKLAAFEALLDKSPAFAAEIVLVQVLCAPPAGGGEEAHGASAADINALATRINAKHARARGGVPAVHLELRPNLVPVDERLALWLALDGYLNTAIRDGLNLQPLEYAVVRGALGKGLLGCGEEGGGAAARAADYSEVLRAARPVCGGIVISEFSGVSRVLAGALRTNPWKLDEVVSALEHALSMEDTEADARAGVNLQYAASNTTSAWAERALGDLKQSSRSARAVSRTLVGYGLGLGYRLQSNAAHFRPLNVEHVLSAYRRAARRLIVVDYGGTLKVRDSKRLRRLAFEQGQQGRDVANPLAPNTLKALSALSQDPKNVVFVISGKEREVIAESLCSLPHVGMAAEHGFFYRWGMPRSEGGGGGGAPQGTQLPPPLRITAPSDPSARRGLPSGGAVSGSGGARASGTVTGSSGVDASSEAGSGGSFGGGGGGGGGGGVSSNTMPWLELTSAGGAPSPPTAADTSDAGSARGSSGGGAKKIASGSLATAAVSTATAPIRWKALVGSIMETYAARTHGTYVLRKSSALSWHYGDADAEFGAHQAKELQDHLVGVCNGLGVEVLSGVGWVEVRPRGVSKGAALARVMDSLEAPPLCGGPPPPLLEFILCIGDDLADEDMFTTVQGKRKGRVEAHKARLAAALSGGGGSASASAAATLNYFEYTVTVGKKPSAAAYFIDTTTDTEHVLKQLARVTMTATTGGASAAATAAAGGAWGPSSLRPIVVQPTGPHAASTAAKAAAAAATAAAAAGGGAGGGQQQQQPPAGAPYAASSIANLLALSSGSTLNLAGLNTNVVFDPAFASAFPGAAAAAERAAAGRTGDGPPSAGGGVGGGALRGGAVSMVSFPMAFAVGLGGARGGGGGGDGAAPGRTSVTFSTAVPPQLRLGGSGTGSGLGGGSGVPASRSPPLAATAGGSPPLHAQSGASTPTSASSGSNLPGVAKTAAGVRVGQVGALAGLFAFSSSSALLPSLASGGSGSRERLSGSAAQLGGSAVDLSAGSRGSLSSPREAGGGIGGGGEDGGDAEHFFSEGDDEEEDEEEGAWRGGGGGAPPAGAAAAAAAGAPESPTDAAQPLPLLAALNALPTSSSQILEPPSF
jgi:trehalose-phosphatase